MQLKNFLTAAVVTGAIGITISQALAGPLLMNSTTMPMGVPKLMAIPISTSTVVQTKLLNTYRQVRSFWLSRAIVR